MADVPSIISDQQTYANSWAGQANAFINRVADLANSELSVTGLPDYRYAAYNDVETAEAKMTALTPPRPDFPSVSGTAPTTPTFTFSDFIPVEVTDFLSTVPVLSMPTTPSAALPGAPSAPDIRDVAIPASPALEMPTAPSLSTYSALPSPPSIELPYFSSDAPIDDLVAPSSEFSFYEQAYSSALLDATKAKLLGDMENGGYGIEPDDEILLWERARSREHILAQIGRAHV